MLRNPVAVKNVIEINKVNARSNHRIVSCRVKFDFKIKRNKIILKNKRHPNKTRENAPNFKSKSQIPGFEE